jgi:hypothetical protein
VDSFAFVAVSAAVIAIGIIGYGMSNLVCAWLTAIARNPEATQLPGGDKQDDEFVDGLVNQAASNVRSTLEREDGLTLQAVAGVFLAVVALTFPASKTDVVVTVQTGDIAPVVQ